MKTTIEMACEVGLHLYVDDITEAPYAARLKAFEALIRADEREACAKLADQLTWADNKGVASAIRARENT
jgi:hypothetical protein